MAADREKVTTPEFRLSFPAVFQPRAFQGGEPKFSVSMIFAKDADLKALKAIAKKAVEAKWGKKQPPNLRKMVKRDWRAPGAGPSRLMVMSQSLRILWIIRWSVGWLLPMDQDRALEIQNIDDAVNFIAEYL